MADVAPLDTSDTSDIKDKKRKKHKWRGRKKGATKIAVERRRDEIRKAIISNEPFPALQKRLGVSQATFYKDLKIISKETREHRLNQQDQLLHDFFSKQEWVLKELYENYLEKRGIGFLQEYHRVSLATFDRLQSAGFILKKPVEMKIENVESFEEAVKDMPEKYQEVMREFNSNRESKNLRLKSRVES